MSNLGEQLVLSNSDSVVIDSISYLPQSDDVSFGRSPNGIGSFNMLTPTFKANNDVSNSISEIAKPLLVFPNPFSDFLHLNAPENIEVEKYIRKSYLFFRRFSPNSHIQLEFRSIFYIFEE